MVKHDMKTATYFHRVGSDWIPCDEATAGAQHKDQLDKKLMRPRAIRNTDINLAIQQTPISPVDMTPFQELMPAAAAAAPASTSEDNAVPAAAPAVVQTAGAAVQTADAAVQTADATASVPIRDKYLIHEMHLTRMLLMDQDFIDESATHPLELIRRDKFQRYLHDITALVLYKHEVKMTSEAAEKLHEAAEEYVRDYLANGVGDDVYKQLCAEFEDFNTQEEDKSVSEEGGQEGEEDGGEEDEEKEAAPAPKRTAAAAAAAAAPAPKRTAAAAAAAAAPAPKRPKKTVEVPLSVKLRGTYTVEEVNKLSLQQLVAQVCASPCPVNPDYGWQEAEPSPHRGRGGGQGKNDADRKAYWVRWLTDPEFMTYRENRNAK
jgi:hypothetical protein